MNSEAHEYRVLIMNMRRIGREIDYILNYINRYQRYILSGLVANDDKSFDRQLDSLKERLTYKRNRVYSSIIPALEAEMQAIMSRWGYYGEY